MTPEAQTAAAQGISGPEVADFTSRRTLVLRRFARNRLAVASLTLLGAVAFGVPDGRGISGYEGAWGLRFSEGGGGTRRVVASEGNRSTALRNSCAVWKRSSGDFARDLSTICESRAEMFGLIARGSSGRDLRW